jgi:hypothetical protein
MRILVVRMFNLFIIMPIRFLFMAAVCVFGACILLPDLARQILLAVSINIDLSCADPVALDPVNFQPSPDTQCGDCLLKKLPGHTDIDQRA